MNVNTSFSERLEYLKNHLGITSGRRFADIIGISHANYQSYKRGSSPSLDKVIHILSSVENLNPDWLIFGNEPIFKQSEKIKDFPDAIPAKKEEENDLELKREDFEFLKKQVSDLTEINKNLSSIIREKNTADTA